MRSLRHEQHCKNAKAAIDALFADRSVEQHQTLCALQDLQEHICIIIDAIKSDLNDKIKDRI